MAGGCRWAKWTQLEGNPSLRRCLWAGSRVSDLPALPADAGLHRATARTASDAPLRAPRTPPGREPSCLLPCGSGRCPVGAAGSGGPSRAETAPGWRPGGDCSVPGRCCGVIPARARASLQGVTDRRPRVSCTEGPAGGVGGGSASHSLRLEGPHQLLGCDPEHWCADSEPPAPAPEGPFQRRRL